MDMSFLLTAGIAAALVGLCVLAMAVGLMVRGTAMRGGCRTRVGGPDGSSNCDTCGRKESETCPRSDQSEDAGKPAE
jgi:hypothetical protein